MSQKSPTINLSNTKTVLFHKIPIRQGQESKSLSATNQRLLILSTPIKLKDGTVNMEQRTIPLRIDNSELTITATENKNKIVSLKRSIEPLPLALPINQLNKKSPTFVKNEVGQVMGKLIPLGKFSDITRNNLSPISCGTSLSGTAAAGIKRLKQDIINSRGKKVPKLDEVCAETSNLMERINVKSGIEVEAKNTANTSSLLVPKVENVEEQVTTVTDAKSKKRVHLVLKGCKNMASIGETGPKIKLIPLTNWMLDEKFKLLRTLNSCQPKIVDVRSCTFDEMNRSDNVNFKGNKLNSNFDKVDSDIDKIGEMDQLDCGRILCKETKTFAQSLKNDLDIKRELELPKQYYGNDKHDGAHTISESGRLISSKILTLAKGEINVELKFESKPNSQSLWAEKNDILPKSTETDEENEKKLGEEVPELEKADVNYEDLHKRFGINKNNVTKTETAMLSYICSLKKKLSQSQMDRAVRELTAIQSREYLNNNNLSNMQKRFIESQLRNSGRLQKKARFIKSDLVMARDILRAIGPRGYSNLRKLFPLPDTSAVIKAMSKT